MGTALSRRFSQFLLRKHRRLLIIGLDGAGKTTILFRMYAKKAVQTQPTEGYNVQTFQLGGLVMNVWDVGGQDELRRFWRHYYTGTQGIVFVIDSSDTDRLKAAKMELTEAITDPQLDNAAILVLANKQDQPEAMPPEELSKSMGLPTLLKGRTWRIQGSVGTTADGLIDGFKWLGSNMRAI